MPSTYNKSLPIFFLIAALSASIALFSATSSCTQPSPTPVRPSNLIQNPNTYLNSSVETDILEPLYGPSTPAALAALEYGQIGILIPDLPGAEISLVPAAFRVDDPKHYKNKSSMKETMCVDSKCRRSIGKYG